jgi:peptide/nickel transport system substrate-binding protein
MKQNLRGFAAAGSLVLAMFAAEPAFAQRQGGILRLSHFDSPASMSILEESTGAAEPMMGVFTNLVAYKQDVPQTSLQTIVPDRHRLVLDLEGTELGSRCAKASNGRRQALRPGRHVLGTCCSASQEKLRVNPRKSWYGNVEEVRTNGVTGHLQLRPQPAYGAVGFGWSPVYPAMSLRDMRSHPIGTGLFKFVEFKPPRRSAGAQPDYWKPAGLISTASNTIIREVATRNLAFIAGKSTRLHPMASPSHC